MRTVDPELWYRKVKKPPIQVTRSMTYGLMPATGFEGRLRASFNDAMQEFRNNCSVRAIVRVSGMDDNWKKKVHIAVLATAFCISLFVVCYNLYLLGNMPPLLISLQTSQRASPYGYFPAVALCSTHIFSAKALDEYAKFLSSKDNNRTYTEEMIRRNLMNFGALQNRAATPAPVDMMFTRFLTRVNPPFNLTDLMLKLSPQCSSMLTRCSWRGHVLPCERLFGTRITQLGYCCVFNSRYQPEDINTPPKILDMVGQDFGLTFLVQNKREDFIYSRRPTVGYEILMFDGSEFPLMQGGGVRSYLVEHNTSALLAVRVRADRPSHTLKHYNEKWRGCRLRERQGAKSWRSSYAWCLAQCRRRLEAALCACAPYTLPAGPTRAPHCTPDHFACLNKHKEKFMYYYPGEHSAQWSPALGEELQDALDCLHCMPDCARLVYSGTMAYVHYKNQAKLFRQLVTKGMSLEDATVVRIFYTTQRRHQQYVVEGYLRWYEAVAMVSCQWVSVMGVTALVVMQLVYCCLVRWPLHYRRRVRLAQMKKSES